MASQQDLMKLLALLDTPEKKAALLEALSSKDKVQAINRFDLSQILFSKQLEMIEDPSKKKVVVAGRRSGKTFSIAVKLLHTAMTKERSLSLYIGLTKSAARNVIWDILMKLIEDYKLPCSVNEHILVIKFNNGARILVEGAKDSQAAERLRGMSFDLVILDECQGFSTSFASSLVSEVLSPAISGVDGELVLAGTPDPLCKSVLFLAWKGEKPFKGFKPFHWNVTHNVKLPRFVRGISTPETYLKEICEETGYNLNDFGFRREYLGEFVEDSSSLVYGFNPDRDLAPSLPEGHEWNYVVSADAGFNDSDAIVVAAFSYTHKIAYFVDSYSAAGQDFSSLAEKIVEFNEKYSPIMTIIDPGGGGLKIVEEMNNRYKIRAEPAGKYNPKAAGCALMASDFRRGILKVIDNPENQLLIAQFSNITFITKTDRDGNVKRVVPDGKQVVTSQGVIGDDEADSALYAFRYMRNYYSSEPEILSREEMIVRQVSDHKKSVADMDKRRIYEQAQQSRSATWF